MNSMFLLSLISHILGDFLFQSNAIARGRSSSEYQGITRVKRVFIFNGIHTLIHGVVLILLIKVLEVTSYVKVDKPYLLLFLIIFSHFLIDISKPFLIYLPKVIESSINKLFERSHLGLFSFDTNDDRVNFGIFILDQIFHTLIILIIFKILYNYDIEDIYIFITELPNTTYIHDKVLAVILILLISTFEAAYFSKFLLNSIKTFPCVNSNNEASRGGFLIGILERIFIILGIVLNHATAIALVLTLKSIARYKKFDNDSFTEYYIIGTFLSFVIAILGGVCIANII